MELAAEVLDNRGRQLLAAGTVLTPRELSAFEFWSISAVDVTEVRAETGADFPLVAPISPEEEERVRNRFRHFPLTHPAEQILLSESLIRAARRSTKPPSSNDASNDQ